MSEPDLVLHVGVPRSGAVLHRALLRLRPQLRAHAVAYVGGSELEGLPHANGWDGDAWRRRGEAAAFAGELAARVAAERRHAAGVRGHRPVRVVLSSDRLLGSGDIGLRDAQQLRPHAVLALSHVVEALSARRVRVILYSQRQDRLMELAHLQRVYAGQSAAFEDYYPYRFEPVLDYRSLVDRLRAVPRVCEVAVRPVELADAGVHAFVNDFLRVVGLEDVLDLYPIGADLLPHPAVYSARGVQLAQAINPLMETAAELELVREFLTTDHAAGDFGTTDLIELDAREQILAAYADGNRELFRAHMPDLPADSYADDSATFELGNVLRQPGPRRPASTAARLGTAAAARTTNATVRLIRQRDRAQRWIARLAR
ncbi:MAG: hypothetical protein ACRDWT_18670 [Jatrophihabitantaceae bacterium]